MDVIQLLVALLGVVAVIFLIYFVVQLVLNKKKTSIVSAIVKEKCKNGDEINYSL